MSDSIREQLMKLGLKPAPQPQPPARPQPQGRPQGGPRPPSAPGKPGQGKPHHSGPRPGSGQRPNAGQRPNGGQRPAQGVAAGGKPNAGKPQQGQPRRERTAEEMDLARAYALRAQAERAEAEALKRAAEEKARLKRERKEQLTALLDGKGRNDAEADQPRHFEHRGKIRRLYVTETQLVAVNNGDLGIVQLEARYLLVDRALAEQVQAIAPDMVAVLLNPGEVDPDELGASIELPNAEAAGPVMPESEPEA
ncbi:MAG: DUF2058 family protein [Ahniella sp.]|nr:DUF2058 family protein [Ahniella sp.]